MRQLRLSFGKAAEIVSQGCLNAARRMQRAASEDQRAVASGEAAAIKQRLKALSTAVYVDTGAAISLVQEASQHYVSILRYVALGDVPV